MVFHALRAAFAVVLASMAALPLAAPARADDPRVPLIAPDAKLSGDYCKGFDVYLKYTTTSST